MTVFELTEEEAFNLYFQGYKLGKRVETLPPISKRVAKEKFERYLDRNMD